MNWIVIVAVIVSLFFYLTRDGTSKFWKLVNRNPQKAYNFFIGNDCWYVIHPGENKTKPKIGQWSGPFFVIIPEIGRIKIYGRDSDFELKQQEFINQLSDKK